MAHPTDERRPILVQLSREKRARISGYITKRDCLEDLTTLDLVQKVRMLIGDRFYPSWAPVADFVQISPTWSASERINVYFFIGTVADLISHIRLHLGGGEINEIEIRTPTVDQTRQYIFVIGACRRL